jgi:hypothetical protein
MRDWAQRHYIKHPTRSLALAAYRLLRGDTRTALRRHTVRAFVGLKQSGLIPNGTIERLFFGRQTNKGLAG